MFGLRNSIQKSIQVGDMSHTMKEASLANTTLVIVQGEVI